jgi:erythromycin esterase-like protein
MWFVFFPLFTFQKFLTFFSSRRNTVILDFITWLRKYNEKLGEEKKKTGFFGIDLYSLQASREEVLKYLEKNDPGLFCLVIYE